MKTRTKKGTFKKSKTANLKKIKKLVAKIKKNDD
jgi:hypothetical protein